MFDILLEFVQRQCLPLLRIYNKERKDKPNGLMMIIEEKRSADVRYFESIETFPGDDNLKKEFEEKKELFNESTEKDAIKVEDAWIVDLPTLNVSDFDDSEGISIWYLVLDDSHKQVLFVGVPYIQEDVVQYTLFASSSHLCVLKNYWRDEETTMGQKYLRSCFEASQNPLNYMIFRSNSDYCAMINKISPNNKEFGRYVLQQANNSAYFSNKMDRVRALDSVGSPITYNFNNKEQNTYAISTLRYLYTALQIRDHFGKMKDWKLCEMGGSSGGLCYLLSLVTSWKEYKFVEIGYCLDLAKIVLAELKVPSITLIRTEDFEEKETEEIDLFISEYFLESLTEEGVTKYQWVLQKSKNAIVVTQNKECEKIDKKLHEIYSNIKIVRCQELPDQHIYVCKKEIDEV